MDNKIFTAKEFANELGITKSQLFEMEKNGVLPAGERDPKSNYRIYSPQDLAHYRGLLDIPPLIKGPIIQLFLNFKGGTGKTSISTSYAYRVAEMGYRTLLIDLDPQGHVSKCLGFDVEDLEHTLLDVLVHKRDITSLVQKTPVPTLDIIPSNLGLSPVEIMLVSVNAREYRLKKALKSVTDYDLIVFDAPPNIGILNLNAILSSQHIIIPVLADFLSFHGLKILFETLTEIEEDFDFFLDGVFILLNKYNASQRICNESFDALKKYYHEYLLHTVIRQDTKIAEASNYGKPIFQFAPSAKGSKDIQSLIFELFRPD